MSKATRRIFGPVPSRRLGLSLGIDVVPFKTCTFDCVYCQLGRTTNLTVERREYVPLREVIAELSEVLATGGKIDWITFSGSGEPTLHSRIGEMIRIIKGMTCIPVAVLTNGTLLYDRSLREELRAADLVSPSVDAGSAEVFRKLNRPHPRLSFEKVIKGTAEFAAAFPGRLWLEVMLVRGLNDDREELKRIASVAGRIKPERVQLNTVARPPADPDALRLSAGEMQEAKSVMESILTDIPVEVIARFEGGRGRESGDDAETAIIVYLRRRPATLADLSASLGLHRNEVAKYVASLLESGRITEKRRGRDTYYVFAERTA